MNECYVDVYQDASDNFISSNESSSKMISSHSQVGEPRVK